MISYIGFPQDSSSTCICLSRETERWGQSNGGWKGGMCKLSPSLSQKAASFAFKRKGLHTSVAVAAAVSNVRRKKCSFCEGVSKREPGGSFMLHLVLFLKRGRDPFFFLLLNLKNDVVVFVEGGVWKAFGEWGSNVWNFPGGWKGFDEYFFLVIYKGIVTCLNNVYTFTFEIVLQKKYIRKHLSESI